MRPTLGRLARNVAATALAGSLLVLSACGSEDEPSTSADEGATPTEAQAETAAPSVEYRNAAVPDTDPADTWGEDQLPEEPDRSEPFSKGMEHHLLVETATFAHDFDPDGVARCPDVAGSADETVTCSVTYFGTELTWEVTVSGGDYVASYRAESPDRVVSRTFVEDALRFEQQTEDVYCDIEEHQLISVAEEETIDCWSLKDDEETKWELSFSSRGSAYFYRV